jgi:hypothetical protein
MASSCALALAACGGGNRQEAPPPPRLPRVLAQQLATKAERVAALLAADDRCRATTEAADLRAQVIAAINAHRVPAAFLEPLSNASNELAARIGACAAPPPQLAEHGKHRGHGKKGHGKHGHEGDD